MSTIDMHLVSAESMMRIGSHCIEHDGLSSPACLVILYSASHHSITVKVRQDHLEMSVDSQMIVVQTPLSSSSSIRIPLPRRRHNGSC